MATGNRENWCLRCGRCCHEKIRLDDGRVLITDIPCDYLDAATRLCRVYDDRSRRQMRCQSASASAEVGALPGDCPYALVVEDYLVPFLLTERPEYSDLVDALYPGRSATVAAQGKRLR